MRLIRSLAAALALGLAALGALAQGEGRPPPPLSAGAGGRVVVQFKADAAMLRERALAARADAATAAQVLQQRAGALGLRHGLSLVAGPAVSPRAQVVSAEGVDARALAARLATDPEVEFAEATQRMRALAVPNDPLFLTASGSGPVAGQWYLRTPDATLVSAINAVAAWDLGKGNATTPVAVLDTGVRLNHPDLQGKLLGGYDFVSDPRVANDGSGRDTDPSDPGDFVTAAEAGIAPFEDCTASNSSWHGTQVAGLVGAATDNGIGMAGTGWNTPVVPVRVLGKCFGDSADIQAGMRWAAGLAVPGVPANPHPAKVINLSLGSDGSCSASYQNVVNELVAAGVVVVAAAGNSAGLAVGTPANCQGVIAVGALRHVGTKVGFSDVGPEIVVSAPGGNCVNIGDNEPCLYPLLTTVDNGSTVPGSPTYTDSYRPSYGTSFSAPLVSASVALLLAQHPELVPAQVKAMLQASARPFPTTGGIDDTVTTCHAPNGTEQLECYCTTSTCGAGMLDTAALLAASVPPPPPPAPAPSSGGGGAANPLWLLALLAACAGLRRPRVR